MVDREKTGAPDGGGLLGCVEGPTERCCDGSGAEEGGCEGSKPSIMICIGGL